MKEIHITDIENIRIGQAENAEAGTGCTVFVSEQGMRAGLDVRGGGPASRDTQLLNPLMAAGFVHSIVLGGGSAFGLGASNGVMTYLEEHGIGFPVENMIVPLVCQSDIFDLTCGDGLVRPDPTMGYEATRHAMEEPNYQDGNYGAGCGASVGKFAGMQRSMKTGIGSYALQIGDLKVGAVVALNAIGDIFDHKSGQRVAGMLSEDHSRFTDSMEFLLSNAGNLIQSQPVASDKPVTNTTIGVVITNASFEKAQLCKIAGMAHDGYARSIRPVHTSMDGDSIYAVSVGDVKVDQDFLGSIGAEVMSEAILRAVSSAKGAYGLPAASELTF